MRFNNTVKIKSKELLKAEYYFLKLSEALQGFTKTRATAASLKQFEVVFNCIESVPDCSARCTSDRMRDKGHQVATRDIAIKCC